MKTAFVYEHTSLTASAVEELFAIQWSECERNSNKNSAEQRTIGYYRDFLQYLEGIHAKILSFPLAHMRQCSHAID